MKTKSASDRQSMLDKDLANLVPAAAASVADEKDLVARIIAAYVSNNPVSPAELMPLMQSVRDFLGGMDGRRGGRTGEPVHLPLREPREPAVPVDESVSADYIICLEDGVRCKILKRYLRSRYAMSPEQYRRRWSLPESYPMVAPSVSQARSQAAKKMQLGGAKAHRRTAAA
jgi:predicted transcriptional regulator